MTAHHLFTLLRYCCLACALGCAACASQPEEPVAPPATEEPVADTPEPVINIDEALRFASSQGDLPQIRALVAEGADPLRYQGKQPSAVDLALASGNADVRQWAAQFLLPARGYRDAIEAIKAKDAKALASQLESNAFYLYPDTTPLTNEAITQQCDTCLSTLIDAGYRLDASDPDGNNALIQAASLGRVALLKTLLEHMTPAERRLVNKQGDNALHTVLRHGNLDDASRAAMVSALLAAGLDANTPAADGRSAFSMALDAPWITGLSLLANDSNINATNSAQQTPLQQAILANQPDTLTRHVVQQLLTKGADADTSKPPNPAPVALAVQQQKPLTLKALIDAGADRNVTDAQDLTPLMQAVIAGNSTSIGILANNNPNLDATTTTGLTALQLAVSDQTTLADTQRVNIIRQLTAAGANLEHKDQQGDTALLLAVANGLELSTQALLAEGADSGVANRQGWTPLMFAIRNNLTTIAATLATEKDSINLTTDNGWSALHLAVDQAGKTPETDTGMVDVLVTNGALLDARTRQGMTPLYLTAIHNLPTIADTLLAAGAKPDMVAEAGWTPLMAAVYNNSMATVAVLATHTDDINRHNQDGWTALHFSASRAGAIQGDIAHLLLEQGAQVDALNKGGMTPLQLAAMNDQAAVAEQLLAYGANRYRKNWLGMDAEELAFFSNSQQVLALLKHYPKK